MTLQPPVQLAGPRAPVVFVSYAHDDPAHRAAVRRLAELLLDAGIDVRLDQFAEGTVSEWPRWAEREVRSADAILVVASPDYRRRADDEQCPDGSGRGLIWELAFLRELVYAHRQRHRDRIVPVVLPGRSPDDIPFFLGPAGGHRVVVPRLDRAGTDPLTRLLLHRPRPPNRRR